MPARSQTTGHNGMSGHGGPGYRAGLVDEMPHDIGVSAAIVAEYSMENSAMQKNQALKAKYRWVAHSGMSLRLVLQTN